jgi:formylglycine-generating enzyme required for sulfatase activity
VDWAQAGAYCAWAGKRLPTEAEWEKAGRGSSDTRLYPWGDEPPTCALANFGGPGGCTGDSAAVGSHPAGASPYGVQDMAGNVSEWVADWWYTNYSLFSATLNPLGPVEGDTKVSRGGDWNSLDVGVARRGDPRSGFLAAAAPQTTAYTGFRCAASTEAVSGAISGVANGSAGNPLPTATPAFSMISPASDKANGIGRVLWNGQPVKGTQVKLCKDLSSNGFNSSDCNEEQASTKTDKQGVYRFQDIPPAQYIILANSPGTSHWFFLTSIEPKQNVPMPGDSSKPFKFDLNTGQTSVIPDLTIYKYDLKLAAPVDEDVVAKIPTLTWENYAGAAFYGVTVGYLGQPEKVLTNSLQLSSTVQNCEYPWKVTAYNQRGEEISEAWNWSTFYLVGQAANCHVQLNSPATGAQLLAGKSIQFSWQPNALATDYEIYISDAPNPFTRVTSPTYKLEQGLPVGKNNWKISAYKDNELIAGSDYGAFELVESSQSPTNPENPLAQTPTPVPIPEMPMVLIPAGPFQMGGNRCTVMSGGNCLKWEPGDDDPLHTVTLKAFKIDATEVTNAMYEACVAVGMCRPLGPGSLDAPGNHYGLKDFLNYPVTEVTWYDARAFCTWRGAHLPSEAEWEKAARGGLRDQMYPWGNEAPVCTPGAKNGAQTGDCTPANGLLGDSAPVGSYASNAYGIFDMSGNVAEYTNDWYQADYYNNSPANDPIGPDSGENKVIRGGNYEARHTFLGGALSVYVRGYSTPSMGFWDIGFRCVADDGR